jgi:hypothetical protein
MRVVQLKPAIYMWGASQTAEKVISVFIPNELGNSSYLSDSDHE